MALIQHYITLNKIFITNFVLTVRETMYLYNFPMPILNYLLKISSHNDNYFDASKQ